MKIKPLTVPSQDIGLCGDCGSKDLEVELDVTSKPAEPNPAVLTGVMTVDIDARPVLIRCRACGNTKDPRGR